MPQKELIVSAIKNGTVIDHIKAGQALKIAQILKLPAHKKIITLGLNLPSRAFGSKDILKIEGRELTPTEANEIAILAPKASVNIIRNYKIVKKFTVSIPKSVESFIVCPNPSCVTNSEPMKSYFDIVPGKEIRLRCRYCEKTYSQADIRDYNL